MKTTIFATLALALSLVAIAPSASAGHPACYDPSGPTPSVIVDADDACVVVWTDHEGMTCVLIHAEGTDVVCL